MEKEQARTIEVLQLAVRMEVEGKEFYLHLPAGKPEKQQ